MMYQLLFTSVLLLSMMQNQLDHLADPHIHDKEKHAEKENGDDDDERGALNLRDGRPGDVAHLLAHLVQEFLGPRRALEEVPHGFAKAFKPRGPSRAFVAGRAFAPGDCLRSLRHFRLLHSPYPIRGRGGGIRTPTSGFG